jgi:hypothetical protein
MAMRRSHRLDREQNMSDAQVILDPNAIGPDFEGEVENDDPLEEDNS